MDTLLVISDLSSMGKLSFMGRAVRTGSTSECVAILRQIVEEQERRIQELEAMVWPTGK